MLAIRYAWRSLARSPGFVAMAVLALGMGLGLSTTMFAVLDAIVNPYVAYRDPSSLFGVRWWYNGIHGATPADLYRELADATHDLGTLTPTGFGRAPLEMNGETRDVFLAYIRPDFFTVTGIRPRLGRGIVEGDPENVAVVSDALWRRFFPRRSTVAGATITVGSTVHEVVGVMPRGSIAPGLADVWIPVRHGAAPVAAGPLSQLLRLKPGVKPEQADARLKQLGTTLTARWGTRERPVSVQLTALSLQHENVRDIHKAMVGSAILVLLIACANLANLMLARGLARRRELALRMALGASRAAIVRQLLVESGLIAVAGAVLGGLGATWGVEVLVNRMPEEIAWVGLLRPQLSWRVFALSAVAAGLSGILFGLLPAIRVAREVSLDEPLKDGAGTTTRTRGRYSPLVITEGAMALVLVMGGWLLLRAVRDIQLAEYTFDAHSLISGYLGTFNRHDTAGMIHRDALMAMVAQVTGVREVAFATHAATIGGAMTAEMVGGDTIRTINAQFYSGVSPQYLKVYGLRMVQGRDFEPGDVFGNGKAILNAVAAQQLYPHGDAVGHMIKLGAPARDAPWVPIIGIVRNAALIRGGDLSPVPPEVYVARPDEPSHGGEILIRATSDDPRTVVAIRRRLNDVRNVWVYGLQSYGALRDAELESRVFLAGVFVSMGTVALALVALGLYSVLAYAVGQRTREFAVRIALGARSTQLSQMVLYDGAVMILAGTGIGAFAALLAANLLDAVLATIHPSDPLSLAASELILIAVGFLAAFGPARRASRANPMDILRAV